MIITILAVCVSIVILTLLMSLTAVLYWIRDEFKGDTTKMILLTLKCDLCKKEWRTRPDGNGVVEPLRYRIIVDNPMIMLDTSERNGEETSKVFSCCEECCKSFEAWKARRSA